MNVIANLAEIHPENQIVFFNPDNKKYFKIKGLNIALPSPKYGVSWIEGLLYPIRTQKIQDFAVDLFLPTTLLYAVKVESVALRLFCVVLAFAIDLVTLPFRLVTALPRATWNALNPPSRFIQDIQTDETLKKKLQEIGVIERVVVIYNCNRHQIIGCDFIPLPQVLSASQYTSLSV